ncbi:MAG: putative methyltransferase, partial [Candidatus Saccharibacteria bacterium]|nr:putative methyltransferase [Candidatus Saccharibacteria bacterium]
MKVKVIAVTKRLLPEIQSLQAEYIKRMRVSVQAEWQLVAPSTVAEPPVAIRQESSRIMATLDPHDYVVLLDERGS